MGKRCFEYVPSEFLWRVSVSCNWMQSCSDKSFCIMCLLLCAGSSCVWFCMQPSSTFVLFFSVGQTHSQFIWGRAAGGRPPPPRRNCSTVLAYGLGVEVHSHKRTKTSKTQNRHKNTHKKIIFASTVKKTDKTTKTHNSTRHLAASS